MQINTEQNSMVIVGLGALTAVGLNAQSTAAAVRAGISGFEEHPLMAARNGGPCTCAMVPVLEPEAAWEKRMIHMACTALQEAMAAPDRPEIQASVAMMIGLPETRPGVPDGFGQRFTSALLERFGLGNGNDRVQLLPNGHASGLMALQSGCRLVAEGGAEFCLVGGVDSYMDAETIEWLEDNEQLHHPDNAWGFIPGEAAGFCLICAKHTARRLDLTERAELLSIATAREENRIKTETICVGHGLTQAVREAMETLPDGATIDAMVCDQNGEAYRADEFGFMLTRLSNRFADPSDYLAPADCWGDIGAASAPMFINQVCAAAESGYAKGPHTLLWTSSEGGERSAAILKAGQKG